MKTPKLGLVWCPRRSIEATYLPIMRCPVYKRRDSNPGSRMELENRVGDDKGKGTSGDPTRLKVPMHRSGAHCLVGARKRGNARRAKGAGHPRQDGVNGNPEELLSLGGSRQASSGWHEPDEARVSRPESVGDSGCKSPGLPGNVRVKRRDVRLRQVWIREMSASKPSMKRRNAFDDVKTRGSLLLWDQHRGHLLTGYAASGV